MSKYNALVKYLNNTHESQVTLTLDELSKIITDLPDSAWVDRTWWGNSKHPSRVQSAAWMGAGWKVDGSEFSYGKITFNRIKKYVFSYERMREIAEGYDEELGWMTDSQRMQFNQYGILMLKQLLDEIEYDKNIVR